MNKEEDMACKIMWQLLLITTLMLIVATAEPRDYCQADYFNVTCPANSVIIMKSASYGRMKRGSCFSGSYGEIGCSEDVLDYMDRKCSGKRRCNVYIAESELHQRNRCPNDLAVYLEANYVCAKVMTSSPGECSRNGELVVTDQEGFLSSLEATDKGYGTQVCPWVIKTNPGQKITLTYYNFGSGKSDSRSAVSSLHVPTTCYEVGKVTEKGKRDKTLTTCGADAGGRRGVVYISATSEVTINFLSKEILRTLSPFVIKYEAHGCPMTLAAPPGGWIKYESGMATIRCNQTNEVWYLTCKDSQWNGDKRGNCTKKSGDSWSFPHTLDDGSDGFPYGILIVVAIGVALGVFIGGLVLSLVYFYMKRKRNPYQEPLRGHAETDFYETSATLKKPTTQTPVGTMLAHDHCPPMTFEEHGHVCGNIIQAHDGYYSAKNRNIGVQRVYDACASSAQRSGHLYERPEMS